MSTVPVVPKGPAPAPSQIVEERFKRLASAWLTETAYVSSSTDMVAHPAFQEIVAMGPVVIPLVFRELENRTGHWHRVLRRITGADPVAADDRGSVEKAAQAWLRWGKDQGYEW